jgi:CelD/BcsL family acetyltransferase involved in cellulose biosynthesis
LEKEHSVKFQLCTADNLEDRLTEFFALHQRRWQSVNVKGMFYASEAKQFYRDIATWLLEKGWLHFSYLDVDGEMVFALFGYIYNGKFYAGTAGRDQRYSKYSVGHLHHMFVIRDAIERGLQEFDLLRGNEPYKFYWTKSTRRYMQVIAIRRGICPGLRLKYVRTFWRLHELRQYRLREIYSLYFMKRREKRELKRMGLKTSV